MTKIIFRIPNLYMPFNILIKYIAEDRNLKHLSSIENKAECKIYLKDSVDNSLEELKEAEIEGNSENKHVKRTFGNIMSAANAEISAIEEPLLMTIENNNLTIQKKTILDPESTEFEMMFFYLQNHVVDFLSKLLKENFYINNLKVEIKDSDKKCLTAVRN